MKHVNRNALCMSRYTLIGGHFVLCFSWDVVYVSSTLCTHRIRELFLKKILQMIGENWIYLKYGELSWMKFIHLFIGGWKNMHKLMKIINKWQCMHLPIHDLFFLLILANLGIFFCAELLIYRLSYSLTKFCLYFGWCLLLFFLYFFWNPLN